jgi:hypothetical protein
MLKHVAVVATLKLFLQVFSGKKIAESVSSLKIDKNRFHNGHQGLNKTQKMTRVAVDRLLWQFFGIYGNSNSFPK